MGSIGGGNVDSIIRYRRWLCYGSVSGYVATWYRRLSMHRFPNTESTVSRFGTHSIVELPILAKLLV